MKEQCFRDNTEKSVDSAKNSSSLAKQRSHALHFETYRTARRPPSGQNEVEADEQLAMSGQNRARRDG